MSFNGEKGVLRDLRRVLKHTGWTVRSQNQSDRKTTCGVDERLPVRKPGRVGGIFHQHIQNASRTYAVALLVWLLGGGNKCKQCPRKGTHRL